MKNIILIFSIFISITYANEFNNLIASGNICYKNLDNQNALNYYQKAYQLDNNNFEALMKMVRALIDVGEDLRSDKAIPFFEQSVTFAEKLLNKYPQQPESWFYCGLAYTTEAAYQKDLKTKVQEADKAYNLINKALELSPNYAEALVVKGAYIREIANLNVILKTIAEYLYGKLPDCSNDGALALFFKALPLYPESKLINYEIAKTYFKMRSLDLAEKYINAAVTGEMDITTEKHITIDIELLQSQIINEKESIRYAAES